MRMFITSKNKYLSSDMKIFGTCSIPLRNILYWWITKQKHKSTKVIFILTSLTPRKVRKINHNIPHPRLQKNKKQASTPA